MSADHVTDLRAALDELHRLTKELRQTLEGIPPLLLLQPPASGGWTLTEDLVHVAEMLAFWSGEIERIRLQPGTTFGRIASNPERIRFIEEHAQDTPEQISALLEQGEAQAVALLERLQSADLEKVGQHMKFGPQTIGRAIQEWLLDHLEEHVHQLQAILAEVRQ
ncbi:MAG TPA: DinB family protein [Ktedonobacterales bacterium]|jgi:uncharacterized damage-inducible protein DinB